MKDTKQGDAKLYGISKLQYYNNQRDILKGKQGNNDEITISNKIIPSDNH